MVQTVGAHSYASNVLGSDIDIRVAAAVAAAMAPFAAMMVANAVPATGKSRARQYCYVHGYCGHKGVTCSVMINAPTTYTNAMLRAKDHHTGGSQKNA